MGGDSGEVVVVLGCRVHGDAPSEALGRRLRQARTVSEARPELSLIFSGGRRWGTTSESEAMLSWWSRYGTSCAVVCESESLTTLQNAARVAALCRARAWSHVHLVTCDFHMPRASALFRKQGLSVSTHPASSPHRGWLRFRLQLREWGARCLSPFEPRTP